MHHLSARPGLSLVDVEFETQRGATMGAKRDTTTLQDFSGSDLSMSDLMLCYTVSDAARQRTPAPGHVRRRGFDLVPMPSGIVNRDAPLYVYFEAYHLATHERGVTNYRVSTILRPAEDRKGLGRFLDRILGRNQWGRGVSVAAVQSGRSPTAADYVLLDLADQPAGQYVLMVRVEDLEGNAVAQASRSLTLE